ncbi:PREDICTED: uncharacterized protein LOC106818178 [Priapulus caudatus]|uniref:Uncharacterized protein LOC106818178 n=1 Tax=Priapulus caudatus TaxID=37621 RepID=A0ABM1F1R9_PRICU|nr:PREDICTED: uncharacterized protein LOC106818178 [Priapulus caudatus]
MDGEIYMFAVNGDFDQSIQVYKLGGTSYFLPNMQLSVNYKCVGVSVFTISDVASFITVAVDGDFNDNIFVTGSSDFLKVETKGKPIPSTSCDARNLLEELDVLLLNNGF